MRKRNILQGHSSSFPLEFEITTNRCRDFPLIESSAYDVFNFRDTAQLFGWNSVDGGVYIKIIWKIFSVKGEKILQSKIHHNQNPVWAINQQIPVSRRELTSTFDYIFPNVVSESVQRGSCSSFYISGFFVSSLSPCSWVISVTSILRKGN